MRARAPHRLLCQPQLGRRRNAANWPPHLLGGSGGGPAARAGWAAAWRARRGPPSTRHLHAVSRARRSRGETASPPVLMAKSELGRGLATPAHWQPSRPEWADGLRQIRWV